MVASPNPSRLPPRGPRDLGTLENTSQNRQLEKQLSFIATNRHMKHLNLAFNKANALLIMYTVYITSQKLYYKNNKKDATPIVLVVWKSLPSLQVRDGAGRGSPPYPPPPVLLPALQPPSPGWGQPEPESVGWLRRGSGSR
jgi:hypothetical protein